MVQNEELSVPVRKKILSYLKANPGLTQAQKNKYLAGVLTQAGKLPKAAAAKTVAEVDPRAAQINAAFGGGPKGPVAWCSASCARCW